MAIDFPGRSVVGGEGNVSILFFGLKIGDVAAIEHRQHFVIDPIVAHLVEQGNKMLVRLAVNVFELDAYRIGLLQGMAAKEIRGAVMFPQQIPFFVLDYGRQLVQITNHQQLYATEGQRSIAVTPQHLINAIQYIRPHHTDFVNDQ